MTAIKIDISPTNNCKCGTNDLGFCSGRGDRSEPDSNTQLQLLPELFIWFGFVFFLIDILPFLPSLQNHMEILLQEAASGELLTSSDHNAISQSRWGKCCLQNCWRLLNVRKWELTSK